MQVSVTLDLLGCHIVQTSEHTLFIGVNEDASSGVLTNLTLYWPKIGVWVGNRREKMFLFALV